MVDKMNEWRCLIAHIRTSILSTVSLRESFLLQSFFMFISNIVFFSFWLIYFHHFPSVKGWTLSDISCLYGIVTGAYGLFSTFLGGCRYLARMIDEGDLDMLMVKPKNLIWQIMASKSISSGWGDILSSIVFLAFSGYLTHLPYLILFIFTSCAVITAFSILMGSLAFWMGNSHTLSKQLFEFILTFSNYPKSIYVGFVKMMLLTLIPSGFIGFMPVDAIKNQSPLACLLIIGFSIAYCYLAYKVFYWGLKNYTSGNKPGIRV